MKILWVKIGGLWPANTGGRLRSFHIISELSRSHELSVITTHPPDEAPDVLADHLPLCKQVISFPHLAPKWNSTRFAVALLQSWFTQLPVDLFKNRVETLRREVRQILNNDKFDLCIADFLIAVPNVPLCGSVPVVLFAHNVEHMIWQRLCRNETRILHRPLLELEWRKMRRYEEAVCRRVDLTITVSAEDRDRFSTASPGSMVCAVPTGVDIDYFKPDEGGLEEQALELVFTGSMDWHPNEDAMLFFIEFILPAIRNELPDVSLTIVGRNPSRQLQSAAGNAGVRVTGTVDDIRPYVDRAAVYVVPLRIGGGTRLKIFEALAMGKAVVSTTVGAEGLPLEDGTHFLRADSPASFANKVIFLLQDPDRRLRLGTAGRRLVAENYSWSRVASDFESCCREAIS